MTTTCRRAPASLVERGGGKDASRRRRIHRRARCASRAEDDGGDDERRARVRRATAALPIRDVVDACLRALEVRDERFERWGRRERDARERWIDAKRLDDDARRRIETPRCARRRARGRRRRFRWR